MLHKNNVLSVNVTLGFQTLLKLTKVSRGTELRIDDY